VTSQDPRASYTLAIDSQPVSNPHIEHRPGQHMVHATATDAAGTTKMATATFVIDLGPPVITNYTPVPESYQSGELSMEVVIDDDLRRVGDGSLPLVEETLRAEVSGGATTAVDVPKPNDDGRVRRSVRVIPNADGPMRVTFTGRDRAGNAAAPWWWEGTIDRDKPKLSIQVTPEPSSGNPWLRTDADVLVTAEDSNLRPEMNLGSLAVTHNGDAKGAFFRT
jgi:hypothetical protein